MKEKIYLDYAATTPVDPRVMEAMSPYFIEQFGNPSSIHVWGQKAENALQRARQTVASCLNCNFNEVIFTSCGSESDNLAIRGTALAARKNRHANHILYSLVEHHAVSTTIKQLADLFDFEIEQIPVDPFGMVRPETVAQRLRSDTAVVSVMYANNEIGTINPIQEIGSLCQAKGIPFHTDAVQAGAYLPMDTRDLNTDLISLGAHKFYGPKGIGVLYVRNGIPIVPIQTGGGQEFGLRAGTHNIPYIVGLAEAYHLTVEERQQRIRHVLPLRDCLVENVLNIQGSHLTGHPTQRLPNHASFVFENVDGNSLLMALDAHGFACSSGSACKTGNPEPSEVLLAMGLPRNLALGSLRVTLGTQTTLAEIESFSAALKEIVGSLRRTAH